MRRIQGGSGPGFLIQMKHKGYSYADLRGPDKGEVRCELAQSQGDQCVYCTRTFTPTEDGMRIEHCAPQSQNPDLDLHWNNLLGACTGGEGGPAGHQTCDKRKADSPLHFNPKQRPGTKLIVRFRRDAPNAGRFAAEGTDDPEVCAATFVNPDIEALLRYLPDGTMQIDNADIQDDIDNILNLNAAHLRAARKQAMQAVHEARRHRFQRQLPDFTAEEIRQRIGRAGAEPFGMAAEHLLKKWLSRR